MEQIMRKYPVGIQTFARIIKEGFIPKIRKKSR